MLLIAWLSFLIWLVLLFARGGFWRVQPAAPLSATTLHALGNAEIARRGAWPALVAVVPARNEADVIGRAVGSLLRQDYAGSFRVIVVDDHSTDGTADAAQGAARALGLESRLIVLSAAALPAGWSGKVWAQSQGIEAIETLGLPADFLLLTDADIHHPADAATQLVARAILEDRDLVSLMVRLRCDSLWEKALIPAFVFFFAKLYPFSWVGDVKKPTAGAAGGCMLVRRSALEEAGGMESIRGELIDDCSLAARLKHRDGRDEARPIRLDLAERSESLRPLRRLARHLEHDRAHGVHATALFAVAAAGDCRRDGVDLRGSAGACAVARRTCVAGVRRVGDDVYRLCADAAVLPAVVVVGAGVAAGGGVLCRCDDRVGGAVLARQGRAVEGAGAGAEGCWRLRSGAGASGNLLTPPRIPSFWPWPRGPRNTAYPREPAPHARESCRRSSPPA